MANPLKYLPFETFVDTAFWHRLAKKKLEEFRLSEGPFSITAEYTNVVPTGLNPRITVDVSAFGDVKISKTPSATKYFVRGQLTTLNSLDEFKSLEKQTFINAYGTLVLKKATQDLEFLKNPDMLSIFQLLTYCDLKHHKFYFWFSYPAILSSMQPSLISSRLLDEEFSEGQISQLVSSYSHWRSCHTSSFFVIRTKKDEAGFLTLCVGSCVDLDVRDPGMYLGFCDPSTHKSYPGWPLRNMLYAIAATLINETQCIRVVCFRERFADGHHYCGHSVVLNIELSPVESSSLTQFVGWEKHENQLKPRMVNLSNSMDSTKLSESAVDLNLKLMKWRLMPDLNLDIVRDLKCLLIGTGTLGCNVSRQLISWGVRHITLVDNSFVSMSNPVRQSLFTFDDAIDGGKPKSQSAASALSKIFPGVHATGFQINIPMPGHPVSDESAKHGLPPNFPQKLGVKIEESDPPSRLLGAYNSCSILSNLISNHDVVFLLTDTRESRWLPTILSVVHGKFVINAALGFDTYLVMRHGLNLPSVSPSFPIDLTSGVESGAEANAVRQSNFLRTIAGSKLGCYFCNDVVAPTNSTLNRSLDQQCTVTRPGVSMMAAAIAVELLVSVMQHPSGPAAPAPAIHTSDFSQYLALENSFSLIPHQIRGFLATYSHILPATSAFKNCSGCSQSVVDAFKKDEFLFLSRVFDDVDYLERVCGLEGLRHAMKDTEVIALSDTEDTVET
ncbi:hypothetical protein P879_10001 [Paragonimus westermani]|uniref:Ubiquitin-like modifier-activating enzyme ATG7 n=1 Tax=Paragonimus westermani TaxID=34504 RepID=A0A8T0D1D6_9TREM|nr:hypothetical protein P879_10001 [Paragonimus westermani]